MDTLHNILQLIWDKGISEKELCQAAGINKSAITDWKKGKTRSYMKHLPEIAKVLGVSQEELLSKTDVKQNPSADKHPDSLVSEIVKNVVTLSDEDKRKILEYAELLSKK